MTNFLDPRLPERFWSKCIPEPNSGCWLWFAANVREYGHFGYDGKVRLAHRFAYAALVAPIADDLVIDHLCRTPSCVNPAHMEPVTTRVNTMRGVGASAQNANKDICENGHEFTPENTRIRRNGWRACRTCIRHWRAEYNKRKKLRATGAAS